MIEIRFVCNLEKLTPAEKPVIASGDVNSVQLRVDFCQKWDKYAKAAVFFADKNPTPIECPMTANACIVPPEVLAESGTFYVGIRGVVANDVTAAVLTTDVVGYRVVNGAPSGVETGPTPDVYQQILTGYGKMDATKQNKLAWATDADIEAMFEGTYEGEEDEDPKGGSSDAVTYTPQTLTEEQKAQARENIGAASIADILSENARSLLITILRNAVYTSDQSENIKALKNEIMPATNMVKDIKISAGVTGSATELTIYTYTDRRAAVNPVGQYLDKGKTYKFSLGDVSGYCYGVQVFVATEAGLTFEIVEGENSTYRTVKARPVDTGWITADYEYTPTEDNCVFVVNFKKDTEDFLTEDDRKILLANFTVKEV